MSTLSISSDALTQIMQEVNYYFPLPVGFKGHHAITLTDEGFIDLGIWAEVNGEIRCFSNIFNEGDEAINNLLLEKLQKTLAEYIRNMPSESN